jgi:hypothetical protein
MGVIAQILRSPESRERYNVSGSDGCDSDSCAVSFAMLVLCALVMCS